MTLLLGPGGGAGLLVAHKVELFAVPHRHPQVVPPTVLSYSPELWYRRSWQQWHTKKITERSPVDT